MTYKTNKKQYTWVYPRINSNLQQFILNLMPIIVIASVSMMIQHRIFKDFHMFYWLVCHGSIAWPDRARPPSWMANLDMYTLFPNWVEWRNDRKLSKVWFFRWVILYLTSFRLHLKLKLIKEKHFNYLMTRHNSRLSAKILRVCVTLTVAVAVRCVERAADRRRKTKPKTSRHHKPPNHIPSK